MVGSYRPRLSTRPERAGARVCAHRDADVSAVSNCSWGRRVRAAQPGSGVGSDVSDDAGGSAERPGESRRDGARCRCRGDRAHAAPRRTADLGTQRTAAHTPPTSTPARRVPARLASPRAPDPRDEPTSPPFLPSFSLRIARRSSPRPTSRLRELARGRPHASARLRRDRRGRRPRFFLLRTACSGSAPSPPLLALRNARPAPASIFLARRSATASIARSATCAGTHAARRRRAPACSANEEARLRAHTAGFSIFDCATHGGADSLGP